MNPADDQTTLLIEYSPRAYDAQKATRITLFHAILTFYSGAHLDCTCKKPETPNFHRLQITYASH
jgi:hypothetical protein